MILVGRAICDFRHAGRGVLTDPIFHGLAISMVFGVVSSTALTLLVIPVVYIWLRDDDVALKPTGEAHG